MTGERYKPTTWDCPGNPHHETYEDPETDRVYCKVCDEHWSEADLDDPPRPESDTTANSAFDIPELR